MSTGRREELLERAVDHVVNHGLGGSSQRQLAAALGVAHNNLTHHFGSRAELLALVFERLAQHTRTLLDTQAVDDPRRRLYAVWDSLADEGYRQVWISFFELLATSLRSPDEHAAFLSHVTADWTVPLTADLTAQGMPSGRAEARATLVVAAVRGLVLDLLAGGQRERVGAGLEELVVLLEDSRATKR